MRRNLLIPFCLVLLVGVVLNLGVALACTIAAQTWPRPVSFVMHIGVEHWPREYRWPKEERENVPGWELDRTEGRGPQPQMQAPGYREGTYFSAVQKTPVGTFYNIIIHSIEAGWPLKALKRNEFHGLDNIPQHSSDEWFAKRWSHVDNPRVASADAESFVLPLKPLWGGFIINSLFYALAIALLMLIPWQIRRHIRIRRGLCPACAYPIAVSDRCSECGQLLAHTTRMRSRHVT